MSMPRLDIEGIEVAYPAPGGGSRLVVDALSLSLGQGGIGCLLGASGCGKTTVLRAVAGFEPVRAGHVDVAGKRVASAGFSLPPEQRSVGMMFQDYALFPHLDVGDNVGFGLRGHPRAERSRRVGQMLELVGLEGSADAFPHELSGGQQQRVALARALAPGPALLLLDEPFSNLDTETRQHLAGELRGLLKATAATVLMVTHDQGEAFAMADHVGVMDGGRILQWDTPANLYARPAHRYVAGFIGRGALVPAAALGLDGRGDVLLRPHALVPDPEGDIEGEVMAVAFSGPGCIGSLRLAGGALVEVQLAEGCAAPGDRLRLRLDPRDLVAFDD